MQRPTDRGTIVRSISIAVAMLLPGVPTPCGAQVSDARIAAWNAYQQASEAFSECRMRGRAPPPCIQEKGASLAAEARYRAEIGAAPARP
jgi:hypothetical protein